MDSLKLELERFRKHLSVFGISYVIGNRSPKIEMSVLRLLFTCALNFYVLQVTIFSFLKKVE